MSSLVSVIVPVYNMQDLVGRCAQSLIGQTWPNLEILLVDDGSTDSSLAVCKGYERQDSRIRCLHKENGGLSDARNFGLSQAKGEWISFVDADDWVEPGFIASLMEKSDGCDIAVCNACYIHTCGQVKVCHRFGNAALCSRQDIFSQIITPLITLDVKNNTLLPCVWNKLYKKAIIDSVGLQFEQVPVVEDFMFNVSCFNAADRVCFIETPLYNHDCTRPAALSRSKAYAVRFEAAYYAHSKVKEIFPQKGVEVFPSVMLYNIKNIIYSYARNLGFAGFKSFCSEVWNMDAFDPVADGEGWMATVRRKGRYRIYIIWAHLHAAVGFLKYYASKLLKRG